jgi:hypothetical protein
MAVAADSRVAADPRVAALVHQWKEVIDVAEFMRRGRRMVYATGGSQANPTVLAVDLEGNAGLVQGILRTFDDSLPPVAVLADAVMRLDTELRFTGIRDLAELAMWAQLQGRLLRHCVVTLRSGTCRGMPAGGMCSRKLAVSTIVPVCRVQIALRSGDWPAVAKQAVRTP